MKTLIKTLAVLTAGVGAVAVVKRVSESDSFLISAKKIILDGKTTIEKDQRNHKTDSTKGVVNEALSMATKAKETAQTALETAAAESKSVVNYVDSQIASLKSEVLATEALDKATKGTESYTRVNRREIIRIVTNGKQATLSMQRPDEIIGRILLVD